MHIQEAQLALEHIFCPIVERIIPGAESFVHVRAAAEVER